ncbi:MAG: methionine--tRNA ligase subunit beta [Candidatus Omnitrophica bacterium]|nr:methionine--tRNA ligase subunit beta [Candidatus Omnitrophota bacterium]
MITIDDFRKIEIVTAKILEVTDHPNADRLYIVKVDLGLETRQVVAGIRQFYGKEELVGRTVIFLKNLQPAVIRGVESNGMILATKDDVGLALLVPQRDIKLGSPIS